MPFVYLRTIRFHETDAAGVVYFANVLTLCHEAYEASLEASGIDVSTFFGRSAIAHPIAHAGVDFWQPMQCGDRLEIHVTPTLLDPSCFEIQYDIYRPPTAKPISQAVTRHVCIQVAPRQRTNLPESVLHWLQQWQAVPAPGSSTAAD